MLNSIMYLATRRVFTAVTKRVSDCWRANAKSFRPKRHIGYS